MEKFMELFMKVSIWGILPAFLAVIVLLSTVMVKCMKKDVATPIEEFSDKRKCHKSEKLYSKVNSLSEAYFLASGALIWPLPEGREPADGYDSQRTFCVTRSTMRRASTCQ